MHSLVMICFVLGCFLQVSHTKFSPFSYGLYLVVELPWKAGQLLAIDNNRNFCYTRNNWAYQMQKRRIIAVIPGIITQRSGYPRQKNEKGRSAGETETNSN